ncbi:hypothetical protein HY844_01175 [Candidatus Berkelbacteria bacterium]|nr:hypothetical protein [Candidatus Berkelbacteria bacterium]
MDYTNILNFGGGKVLGKNELAVIILIAIWELAWKGYALWRAGRKNDVAWFVTLLILNTVGILPILYIFVFSKREVKES